MNVCVGENSFACLICQSFFSGGFQVGRISIPTFQALGCELQHTWSNFFLHESGKSLGFADRSPKPALVPN